MTELMVKWETARAAPNCNLYFEMAAFQYPTEQQFGPPFVTSNPYQFTGAAVIPPTNPPAQHPNNSKAFTPGKKRKLPDNQHDGGIPNKQPAPQPAQQFFCEICNVQLNSLTQAAQHKQGKTHKLNAAKVDQLGSVRLRFYYNYELNMSYMSVNVCLESVISHCCYTLLKPLLLLDIKGFVRSNSWVSFFVDVQDFNFFESQHVSFFY